jgi:hypothetical protein
MNALMEYIAVRPRLAFTLGMVCLLDALNCVAQGHTDWPIPALVAFSIALVMRKQATP